MNKFNEEEIIKEIENAPPVLEEWILNKKKRTRMQKHVEDFKSYLISNKPIKPCASWGAMMPYSSNSYHCFYSCASHWEEYYNGLVHSNFLFLRYTDEGIYARNCSQVEGLVKIIQYVYTPHFLQRYQERFLKDESIKGLDLVKLFLTRNNDMTSVQIEPDAYKKHPDCFVVSFTDGLGFGYFRESGHIILKTFLSRDSMNKKNKAFDAQLAEDRIEMKLTENFVLRALNSAKQI